MYYKCEKNGRCFSHTIEYEHRLDGEMPGTGTVGCGNEHGKRADAEDEECGKDADVCRKGEGKEGDIEMQEVANPYPYAVEDVEPWAAELAERHHPVPESLQFHPCLLQQAEAEKDVYGKAQADDGAEDGNPPSGGGETACDRMDVETRRTHEDQKLRQLAQKGDDGEEEHEGTVDHTFADDGAQGLRERNTGKPLEHAATCHLTHTGNDEAGGVADVDDIVGGADGGMFSQRLQRHPPAQGAEHQGHDAEEEAQRHPPPVEGGATFDEKMLEVRPAVHPPEDAGHQGKWGKYLEKIQKLLHGFMENVYFCGRKNTTNFQFYGICKAKKTPGPALFKGFTCGRSHCRYR